MMWKNVTDTFSEESRYYKNTYMEICEVYDQTVEVSVFSSEEKPYEIYVSYGRMYGIVYSDKESAYEKFEQIKGDLEKECDKHKEPTGEFINIFAEKYDLCLPDDVLVDVSSLWDLF